MIATDSAATNAYMRSASLRRRHRVTSRLPAGKQVADAADRLQDLRAAAVVAELRAQARHVDVDRAIEAELRGALRQIEQLLARQHATGPLRERAEDRELVRGHLDG